MTVIAGMRLAKKLYLISDTRITNRNEQGDVVGYQNDMAKIVGINERISVVAAGNVDLVSHLIKEIKLRIRTSSSASYLNKIFQDDMDQIIKNFVNSTGKTNRKCALIFGGYNLVRKQQIDSKILGEIIATFPKQNEGKIVHQSIDREILRGLEKKTSKSSSFDGLFFVDLPQSELISLEVKIDRNNFTKDYKSYQCYESAIYHPSAENIEKIRIPNELLYDIEFRELNQNDSGVDIFNQDVAQINSYIYDLIEKNNFESVGGSIIVAFQTQYGNAFPTGTYVRRKNSQTLFWNDLFVDEKGVLCYELSSGESGKYRHLEMFLDDSSMDLI